MSQSNHHSPHTTNDRHSTEPTSQTKTRQKTWLFFALFVIILSAGLYKMMRVDDVVQDNPQAPTITTTPVIYDVDSWTLAQAGDITHATAQLGGAGVEETGLDIQGNDARVVRYHALHEPPLTLSQSKKFIELNWYYASPKDSQINKEASLAHAKKAHAFITAYLGSSGHQLMQALLSDTATNGTINNTTTPEKIQQIDTRIHSAKCQDYVCQIVLRAK